MVVESWLCSLITYAFMLPARFDISNRNIMQNCCSNGLCMLRLTLTMLVFQLWMDGINVIYGVNVSFLGKGDILETIQGHIYVQPITSTSLFHNILMEVFT